MLPVLPTRFSHAPVFLRARLLRCPASYAPGFLTRQVFPLAGFLTRPFFHASTLPRPRCSRRRRHALRSPAGRPKERRARQATAHGPESAGVRKRRPAFPEKTPGKTPTGTAARNLAFSARFPAMPPARPCRKAEPRGEACPDLREKSFPRHLLFREPEPCPGETGAETRLFSAGLPLPLLPLRTTTMPRSKKQAGAGGLSRLVGAAPLPR